MQYVNKIIFVCMIFLSIYQPFGEIIYGCWKSRLFMINQKSYICKSHFSILGNFGEFLNKGIYNFMSFCFWATRWTSHHPVAKKSGSVPTDFFATFFFLFFRVYLRQFCELANGLCIIRRNRIRYLNSNRIFSILQVRCFRFS